MTSNQKHQPPNGHRASKRAGGGALGQVCAAFWLNVFCFGWFLSQFCFKDLCVCVFQLMVWLCSLPFCGCPWRWVFFVALWPPSGVDVALLPFPLETPSSSRVGLITFRRRKVCLQTGFERKPTILDLWIELFRWRPFARMPIFQMPGSCFRAVGRRGRCLGAFAGITTFLPLKWSHA